jgi:Tfp pilus assembly protein PilF
LKRTPEALQRLDDAIARYPQNPVAANVKGEVLLSTRQAADSEVAFKTAIERAPKWVIPYRNLAIAQLADHDSSGAIATLQLGIDKSDGAEALQTELAALDERLGKPDDAMQVYEAALRRNPTSDVASNNLAMLLVTYRKDPASLERAKELSARFASSNNPSFLDTYGWVLYKRGDAAAAVSVLQTALTKASESPVSLYHLGMAEALAGQPDAARDSLARSLQSGKNFAGMEEAKATLDKLAKGATSTAQPAKS